MAYCFMEKLEGNQEADTPAASGCSDNMYRYKYVDQARSHGLTAVYPTIQS
jgi:hypothetical protein